MDQVYFSGKAGPTPCEKNSRWRNFAFISKDMVKGKKFSYEAIDDVSGPYVLKIDGYVRTVVSSNGIVLDSDSEQLSPNTEYELW